MQDKCNATFPRHLLPLKAVLAAHALIVSLDLLCRHQQHCGQGAAGGFCPCSAAAAQPCNDLPAPCIPVRCSQFALLATQRLSDTPLVTSLIISLSLYLDNRCCPSMRRSTSSRCGRQTAPPT